MIGYGTDYPEPVLDGDGAQINKPITIAQCRAVFTRWLGNEYDLEALDAVLAAAAVEQLGGDPVWLLMISGAGFAKTETVSALGGAGAHVTSTIKSEAALLSATNRKEAAKDATGGLLRKIGDQGILVVKDFTTILSMSRDDRASVLAALREVYDGLWERNVGSEGGRSITWRGRIIFIGATTTAYDAAHSVIAAMGDRFAIIRTDSSKHRLAAGRQALNNVDHETQMRAELAGAAAGILANINADRAILDDETMGRLLIAADLVTMARTAVERDYQGNVIDAHAPEAPTRFAKMLGQIMRGALALGIAKPAALTIALRVAADSMPPLRLHILRTLADKPGQSRADVARVLAKPKSTVGRELDALHMLGVVTYTEETYTKSSGLGGVVYQYRLAVEWAMGVLDPPKPDESSHLPRSINGDIREYGEVEKSQRTEEVREGPAISGTEPVLDAVLCPTCHERPDSLWHTNACPDSAA